MTIAKDATSLSSAGTGNLSWTHTPVGTPKGFGASVSQSGSGSDQVSGATINAVSLTEVTGSPIGKATGEAGVVYGYWLGSGVPTGAQTVEVTVTGSAEKVGFGVSVTAAADTEVQNTDNTLVDPGVAEPTATLELTGAECFVWEGIFFGGGNVDTIAPKSGWTSDQELKFPSFATVSAFYTYDTVSTADVSVGFLATGSDDTLVLAIAVKEASVGGTVAISAGSDSLTLTGLNAAISLDVDIAGGTDSLTLTELQSAISLGKSISAQVDVLTLTELQAAISLDIDVQAAVDALSITEFASAISQGNTVQAAAASLGLTVLAADVDLNVPIAAGLDTLTVTELAAVVQLSQQGEISAGFDALTITELRATVEGVSDGKRFRITTGYMWT